MSMEDKYILWRTTDILARGFEEEYKEAASYCFQEQKKVVLAAGRRAQREMAKKKSWDEGLYLTVLMDATERTGADIWAPEFAPLITKTVEETGTTLGMNFGMAFDVRNPYSSEFLNERILKFADPINETTEQSIRAVINKGHIDGWSIDRVQKNLGTLFDEWAGLAVEAGALEDLAFLEARRNPFRTEMIARTETMRSANGGSLTAYKSWGVQKKGWIATFDSRVRSAHADAGQKYAEGGKPGPILMDEAFKVGGESLMYPGDPGGSAKNVIFCRCTLMPVWDDSAPAPQAPGAEGITLVEPLNSPNLSGSQFSTSSDHYDSGLMAKQRNLKKVTETNPARTEGKHLTELSKKIAEETQIEPEHVKEMIELWNQTSNDHNYSALKMQESAAKAFGGEMQDWQIDRLEEVAKDRARKLAGHGGLDLDDHLPWESWETGLLRSKYSDVGYKTADEVTDNLVKAIYQETQDFLKKEGIDDVVVWRGVDVGNKNMRAKITTHYKGDKSMKMAQNPLSSWSADVEMGNKFAFQYGAKERGVVVRTKVPRERVFSMARTGPGTFYESEVVLVGGFDWKEEFVHIVRKGWKGLS